MPQPRDWFLAASERGNSATRIDAQHPGDRAWSLGNDARPLIHGRTYFAELAAELEATTAGDLVMFTDWQGNEDERLTDEPGSELAAVLRAALKRGVDVRALIWRSHAKTIGYSADDHRSLGIQLQEHGADVKLDMRVRPSGAHRQKFVVIRHSDDPTRDVAFVGGIDLCHGRRDDAQHLGDPRARRSPPSTGNVRRGTTSSSPSAGRWCTTWRPSSGSAGRTPPR